MNSLKEIIMSEKRELSMEETDQLNNKINVKT